MACAGHEISGRAVGAHEVLYDDLISVIANATGSTADVLADLLAVIAQGMGFEVAAAWRWHAGQDLLRPAQVWQEPDAGLDDFVATTREASLRRGDAVPGVVAATGEALWIREVADYVSFHRGPAAAQADLHSGFAFPVRANDRLVGVIELYSRQYREPDPPLVDAVARVGTRLGQFIERLELEAHRAELLVELEQSRRRQTFLLHVNRLLAGSRSLAETVRRLARAAVPALGDLCLIDIVSADRRLERLAAQHADPRRQRFADELLKFPPQSGGDHPAAQVVRSGSFLVGHTMSTEFLRHVTRSDRHYELTQQLECASYLSVPIRVGERTIGAITLFSAGSGRVFDDEALGLVRDLGEQVAWALDRARRDDEQREVAHRLQQSLLPDHLDRLPGAEAAARYVATDLAADVGGDFYDLVAVGGDRLAAVIGDIEGHDMTAAGVMGRVRNALLAYLAIEDDPARLLHLLDGFIDRHARGRLATLCVAMVTPGDGTVVVASAGHPPPLVAGPSVPSALLPLQVGPPLGLGDAHRPTSTFHLPRGGVLLLYTDGLVEHRTLGPDAHLEDVRRSLQRAWSTDAESVCDAIVSVVDACEHDDDLAVLAVKRI